MANRFVKGASEKCGLPPGTIVHVGDKWTGSVKITVIDYDKDHCQVQKISDVEEVFPFRDSPTVTWINIDGIHDVTIIDRLGKYFNIHPLVLEDILHTTQRPKIEEFEDYIYIVLRMLYHSDTTDEQDDGPKIISEQISLLLGRNFVISFQEVGGDIFDPVLIRLKGSKGRIREMGTDYLAYSLIDSIVDNYFVVLEKLGERIETLEDELLDRPTPDTLEELHVLRNEMIFLRKSVWPLREVSNNLLRSESDLITRPTQIYIKDIYDHTIQVIDTIETYRDMLSGMLDIYLSSINNKMNEVMKVLTIIATIFIPLTFLAGVYGMNFEYMPELSWKWGYPVLWCIMSVMAISMFFYFRKKKWL
ncbi:magnesium/cobalt transporter CorA [Methanomethylovorans sp.]|uniref:magnesium/cobalt transporter CorA n=1 Tax=Methanomethylovorans sp. TaxID=2758717 RepID=UPI00345EA5B4